MLLNWTTYAPNVLLSDQTATGVMMNITPPSFMLSIYALNGSVCLPQPCSNIFVNPRTNVTWRIQYQLPSSAFRSLSFSIYNFPHDTLVTSFSSSVTSEPPITGASHLGPGNTLNYIEGAPLPTLLDSTHSMLWAYNDSQPLAFNTTSFIDILFTISPNDTAYREVYFQFLDVGTGVSTLQQTLPKANN